MNEELKVIITAEISKLKQGVDEAKKSINSFKQQVDDASKNVDSTFKKAGESIGNAIQTGCKVAAAGIATVTTALAGIVTASVKRFADYEQLVGGVETLFKESASQVQEYADNAYKTSGLSANQYMETVTGFSASLLQSLGQDTNAAAQYAELAVTDMSDNANKMGTSMESIQNAYQGFAKQNYTMLDNLKLGYGGTKEEMERLIADANRVKVANGEMADLSIDSFANVVEAIHIIQTEMGITGTTAKEAEGTITGSISMTKAAWENLMIGLANSNADIPKLVGNVFSSATTVLNNIIPVAKEVLKNIPVAISEISPEAGAAFQVIVDTIMAVLPILKEALSTTFDIIVSTISFIKEHTALFVTIAAAIGTVVAAIGLYNAVAAVKAAMDAAQVTTLGALIAAYAAQAVAMMAAIAPYVAIVAAIGAVIAIIVTCIKHWDDIKAKVIEVATAIKDKVVEAFNAIGDFFRNIFSSIGNFISNIKNSVKEGFENVKNTISEKISNAVQTVKDKFNTMKSNISEKVNSIKTAVSEKFNQVKDTIKNKCTEAANSVKEKFETMKKNISEKVENIKSAVTEKFNAVKDAISDKVQSAVQIAKDKFEDMKSNIKDKVSAIKENISEKFESVKSAISSKLSSAVTGAKNAFESMRSSISERVSSIFDTVTSKFTAIKDKITSLINGARDIVKNAIDKIKSFFHFEWSLPKLKLPHISITGKFSLSPPSVPHFGIDWYAKGGVFDSPTLFGYGGGSIGGLGEDGAEAIIPLEKNTQWLDRIAERLNGNGSNIILQVDGKTFGEISVDSINALTRQRGSLPLTLA